MKNRILAVLAIAGGTLLGPGAAAQAGAADFTPAPGSYTVDTGALTLIGPSTGIVGVDQGGVAVFSFDNINVPAGVSITVVGSRPFKLVASGSLTMAGNINGSGASVADFGASGGAGGPGGGAGGAGGSAGVGGGGGDNSSAVENGGGGGGFGGAGAPGGLKPGFSDLGIGGAANGDLNALLQGGSGGAGSGGLTGGGGGGGGAIALVGSSVTIPGVVFVDGGGGAVGAGGGSGGGSGGGIVVRGNTVEVTGSLVARGGPGGAGGCCGDGGGGGGGRIAYQYRTLIASGSTFVTGGASGTRTTTGSYSHGSLSTKATGDTGVVTKVEAPKAVTGPATAVSATSASMNGTVNPSLHPTSYYFEYGTSGSYGSRIPAGSEFVGSDGSDHVVSQVLGGLSPNTTYHYRVVAVDALGFTIPGADIGFTTSAAPPSAGTETVKKTSKKKCKKKFKKKRGKCVKKKKHKKQRKHKNHQPKNAPGRIG